MFKKVILSFYIVAMLMGTKAFAGNAYLNTSIFVQTIDVNKTNYFGATPVFTFGYTFTTMRDCYYIAAEVFGIPTTATLWDHHQEGGSMSLKTNQAFGGSFIPGIFLNELAVGYLRAGVIYTKFSSPNTYKVGAQFGVGLKIILSSYLDLNSDYIYTAYKTINNLGTPKSNAFGLSLSFKFYQ